MQSGPEPYPSPKDTPQRLHFKLVAAWMLLMAMHVGSAFAARPNILFIYTDDQSFRTLSCYKDSGAWPWVQTPNIDRLATEGVRFQVAYGAAWCTPSRASVLTGRYQHAIRGLTGQAVLHATYDPKICRFFPAELRRSGYTTAMIGKWHIGPDHGHGRDWDHSVVWNQADIKKDWYNDQQLSIDGAEKKVVEGYSTDVYTRYATEFIRRDHRQPWFLWLCYNAPHLPNTVHPRHARQYADAEVPIPPDVFGPRSGKPKWQEKFTQFEPSKSPAEKSPLYSKRPLTDFVRGYNRLVSAVDEGVRDLLATLESTGQLENTMIVFTSDQGFAWGEHGFAWKVGPYDACLRMPLLIRWPGKAQRGAVCSHPVTIVDVSATVVAAAGVQLPWTTHGHDLAPLLQDPNAEWSHPAFMEHTRWDFGAATDHGRTGNADTRGVPWWVFLRHGQYKYIRTLVENEIDELYDLQTDPAEQTNLAQRPEQAERVRQFRQRLDAELERTEAGFRKNLPEVRSGS